MNVQLTPGFQGNIKIVNSENRTLYEENYDSNQEVTDFINTNGPSKPGWSVLKSAVCPCRTDNVKGFMEDVFLPTFVNFALKIDNHALKVIGSITAIVFDLLTLPIRLVVTPFRVIYNRCNPEEKHPLRALIEENGEQLSNEEDFLTIHCKTIEVIEEEEGEEAHPGLRRRSRTCMEITVRVALKTLPGTGESPMEMTKITSYSLENNQEWSPFFTRTERRFGVI